MKKTLDIINELETEGVISTYAIGGAYGAIFYTEPVQTIDLDIFCFLPGNSFQISLAPLYKSLAEKGFLPQGETVIIDDIPVQFLIPPSALEEEALKQADSVSAFGTFTKVLSYEHLLAIMVQTNRPKDRARIAICLESKTPNMDKLLDILRRYELLNQWNKIVN